VSVEDGSQIKSSVVGPDIFNDGGGGWDGGCPPNYFITRFRLVGNQQTVWCGRLDSSMKIVSTTSNGPVYMNDGGAGWDIQCPPNTLLQRARLMGNTLTGWCAQYFPSYSCSGSIQVNATSNSITPLTSNGTWTYNETPGNCTYKCSSGYYRDDPFCRPYYCIASTLPANATPYPGDDTGLSANTSYTYAVSNTPPKCQFFCDSGYSWDSTAQGCFAPCDQGNQHCAGDPYTDRFNNACTGTRYCDFNWKETSLER